MEKYKKWGAPVLTALAVLAVLALTAGIYPVMYCINDDVLMRSLLSGGYTGIPEGRIVYMRYPLSLFLSLFYRVTKNVPWFSLFMAGSFWLGCSMVLIHLVRTLKVPKKEKGLILTGVSLLCGVLFLPNYIYLHYTTVAAVLAGCGIFLIAADAGLSAVILLVLSYCVRSQVFFLALPFLGVVVLWQFWEKKGKKQLVLLALLAGCILLCALWNGWMYRTEEWKQYQSYNEARTQLYDYHDLLPYEEYKEQYEQAGIDEAHYMLMKEYLISLDNSVDAEMMQKAAEIHEKQLRSGKGLTERLKDCVLDYYYHMRYTDKPYNYILIGAYVLVILAALCQRRFMQLFLVFCLGGGRSFIWIYLLWRGRFPERVIQSLYILELMLLAGFLCYMLGYGKREVLEEAKKKIPGWGRRIVLLFLVAAGISLSVVGVGQIKKNGEKCVEQQTRQLEWKALTDYCRTNSDNLYLLDVGPMVSYGGGAWEKSGEAQNYFLLGGWMSGTPHMLGKFLSFGAEDGGGLLVKDAAAEQRNRVFFITAAGKDTGWLEEYLSARFHEVQGYREDSILFQGKEAFCVYGFR